MLRLTTSLSWNPEVYYRAHQRPPQVPILRQVKPFQSTLFCFIHINFKIILPPTPSSWAHATENKHYGTKKHKSYLHHSKMQETR
jgi:hypothetical protein